MWARRMRRLLQTEMSWPHLIHELENTTAAASDAGQWIVRDDDREPRFLHQQFVDIAQQRTAAGQDDAALGHVRAEFGRRLLEGLLDGAHDALQGLLQRFENLIAVERKAARHAFGQVATLDRQLAHLGSGVSRADLDLDALGGGLADQDAVVSEYIVHDRGSEGTAADPRGIGVDDASSPSWRGQATRVAPRHRPRKPARGTA